MQKVEVFDPGFSTADANYPEFVLKNGSLRMVFQDWQERTIFVEFEDVHAFKWQEAAHLLPNEPYDGICKIRNSNWLFEHNLDESIYQHYCFNFNVCGKLEVLCISFEVTRA